MARLRRFEVCVALSGGAAFAAVGPLWGAFATLPEVLFAGALILFVAPGVLLTRWLLDDYFSGAAPLPVAFVISAGALALLGVPMLLLQSTLRTYLWASGTAIAASLLAAALVALRGGKTPRRELRTAPSAAGDRCGCRFWPSSRY